MQHCVVAAVGGGRREAEERQSVMRAQYFVLFAAGFVLLCGSKFRGSVVIMLVALVTKVGPIGGGTFAIPSRTMATAVVMRNLTASCVETSLRYWTNATRADHTPYPHV